MGSLYYQGKRVGEREVERKRRELVMLARKKQMFVNIYIVKIRIK